MIGSQTLGAVSLGSVGAALSNTAGWTDARSVFGAPAGASLAFTSNVQIDGDASAWCFISAGATVSTVAGADSLQPFNAYPGASLSFKAKADREGRFSINSACSANFTSGRQHVFSVLSICTVVARCRQGAAGVANVAAVASDTFSASTGSCSDFAAAAAGSMSVSAADGRSATFGVAAHVVASFTTRSDYEEVTLVDPTVAHLIAKYRSPRIEVVA